MSFFKEMADEHCQLSFDLKLQALSIRSHLNKFDPMVSRSSRFKDTPSPKNHGQRKNNLTRKRTPPKYKSLYPKEYHLAKKQ